MYSLSAYGRMIRDSDRMAAYVEALRQSIRPDSVVVDIGTGAGIFASIACNLGARRVFAIEPSDVIEVAREIATANKFDGRIEFFQDVSDRVNLPEPADVIVSDLRGVLPLFGRHLPTIIDARQRMLAPGGVLIPRCDTLWMAVVEAGDLYKRYAEPWKANDYGIDLSAARRFQVNSWRKSNVTSDQLLSQPQLWGTLDYMSVENSGLDETVNLSVQRDGTGHGLCVWFDTSLSDGVGFSNRPGNRELIYGNGFFPLVEPVELVAGDLVNVRISANLVGDDYVWRWETSILSHGNPQDLKADFKQSSFLSTPFNARKLRKQAANFVPTLNEDGEITRSILSMMDGDQSLETIASAIVQRFPNRFDDWKDALTMVGEISLKFGG